MKTSSNNQTHTLNLHCNKKCWTFENHSRNAYKIGNQHSKYMNFTCLKRVLVPDPSNPNNRSFWTLPCSKYSGTDLLENAVGSSFGPWKIPGGTGNENNEQMKRVDACLAKITLKLFNAFSFFFWLGHWNYFKLEFNRSKVLFNIQGLQKHLSPYVSFYVILTFFFIRSIIIQPKVSIPRALYIGHLKENQQEHKWSSGITVK